MTKNEIAILSFKVLSLYAIIQTIDKLYYFLYYFLYESQLDNAYKHNLLLSSVPSLLMASCAIMLWFGAPFLAKSIFNKISSEAESQATLVDMQMIAFSVVGLFILATSLPDLVEIVAVILTASSIQGGAGSLVHNIVTLILKAVLGFWLLLGSQGIVGIIRSQRAKFLTSG